MNFSSPEIILIGIVVVLVGVILWIRLNPKDKAKNVSELVEKQNSRLNQVLELVSDKLSEQNQTLYQGLNQSHQSLIKQFDLTQNLLHETNKNTQEIIKEVTSKLTSVDETNKQIVNFASQLNSLEQVLKNPKQRGLLGEYFLETVLGEVLPPQNFAIQHKFSSGEIVDAAIFTKGMVIPIDAKFSLANYNNMAQADSTDKREQYRKKFRNDLKVRINETSKYIKPDEGTYDFAFMFIPADGVYQEVLSIDLPMGDESSNNVIEYAFSKQVIIVSPMSLYAYLQTVLQGLKALEIEESVKQIQANISGLQKYVGRYTKELGVLGTHLNNSQSAYTRATTEMQNITEQLEQITGDHVDNQELK